MNTKIRRDLFVLLFFTVLTLLMTWPLITKINAVYAGNNQTSLVNFATNTRPAVLVTYANALPVSNAQVVFTPSACGSVVSGTVTTNTSGIAQVGSWTPGATAGGATLTAAVTGFPALTATFNATAATAAYNIEVRNIGAVFPPSVQAAFDSAEALVARVCAAAYGDLFREVWGVEISGPANVAMAYDNIGYSGAAYEASAEVNAFTSKFDYSRKGMAKLTPLELRGHAMFVGKGRCARCHVANGQGPLFTDYTFDNLGLPKNPENPFYFAHPDYVDQGLGGFLGSRADYAPYAAANMGKHKVPTVRNVGTGLPGTTKAYGHNGYFKSLEGIVHFYNTRDVKPMCPGDYTEAQAMAAGCWPAPEVGENVNTPRRASASRRLRAR